MKEQTFLSSKIFKMSLKEMASRHGETIAIHFVIQFFQISSQQLSGHITDLLTYSLPFTATRANQFNWHGDSAYVVISMCEKDLSISLCFVLDKNVKTGQWLVCYVTLWAGSACHATPVILFVTFGSQNGLLIITMNSLLWSSLSSQALLLHVAAVESSISSHQAEAHPVHRPCIKVNLNIRPCTHFDLNTTSTTVGNSPLKLTSCLTSWSSLPEKWFHKF